MLLRLCFFQVDKSGISMEKKNSQRSKLFFPETLVCHAFLAFIIILHFQI